MNHAMISELSIEEQLNVLEMVRHKLRDKETDYRKCADEWHKLGAVETAQSRCDKANAIHESIAILLEVEIKYRNAKAHPLPFKKGE